MSRMCVCNLFLLLSFLAHASAFLGAPQTGGSMEISRTQWSSVQTSTATRRDQEWSLFMMHNKKKKSTAKASKGFGGGSTSSKSRTTSSSSSTTTAPMPQQLDRFPYAGAIRPGQQSPQKIVTVPEILKPDYAETGTPGRSAAKPLLPCG